MKKTIQLTILLAALLSMQSARVYAYDIEVKNAEDVTIYYNFINGGNELEVSGKDWEDYFYDTGNDSYTGEVVIPELVEYEGVTRRVTRIGDAAFSYCYNVTSVVIPESVTSIGSFAFSVCYSLSSITIPNSVTEIGEYAFQSCPLGSFTVPTSMTKIGDYAFYGCEIRSITIPNTVTSIGQYAFSYCTLQSIDIPNSVTSIGQYAFSHCPLKSITIPNSVTRLEDWTFAYGTSLTSVVLPESLTEIGKRVFFSCIDLASVNIPNSVTTIGEWAFSGCWELTSLDIPNSVTEIGEYAFSDCGLTSISIPNSLTRIKEGVFSSCNNLTSVNIPKSVAEIGERAFSYSSFSDVYCFAEAVPTTASTAFDETPVESATLHVPEASVSAYTHVAPWSRFGTIEKLEKCATPTISYVNGKVRFSCETEGVKFVPVVTSVPRQLEDSNEFDIAGTFTISVYAMKEGNIDSEVATTTVNLGQMGDLDGDGELSVTDITSLVNAILGK